MTETGGVTMDYQEVIERFKMGYLVDSNGDTTRKDFEALKIAISAMNELQQYKYLGTLEEVRELEKERKKQEWIPCSERLPEESGKYEVTALDAGRLIVTQVKWQPKLKSWNLTGAMAYWKITAWKPLPEPYRPNKCHGCFGAANNDCERCMDGNEK